MRKFKTESQKLLDLMINSIYTNREIFLRELISNASDAVDKLYFRSLVDDTVTINRADLAITVGFDETERTVSVSDNGIGMTKDELDKNLGVQDRKRRRCRRRRHHRPVRCRVLLVVYGGAQSAGRISGLWVR